MEASRFALNSTSQQVNASVTPKPDGNLALFQSILFNGDAVIYTLIIPLLTFGIIANVLNIVVFVKTGVRDNVTVSFLALSLSDLCFLMVISIHIVPLVIQHFVIFRLGKSMNWLVDPRVLTFPFYWYALFFYELSILITVYIAVVRCACVAILFKVKTMFTARRAVIVFIVFFICIFLLRLPMYLKRRIVREWDPSVNKTKLSYKDFDDGGLADKLNDIVNRNILNFGSMATVFACLVVMGIKLRASAKFRYSSAATKSKPSKTSPTTDTDTTNSVPPEKKRSQILSTRDTQVLRSVILVAVIFVTCQTPAMSYTLTRRIIWFNSPIGGGFLFTAWYIIFLVSRIATFFSVINASVNFFVYYNFNSRYRQTLKALWERK